MPRIRSVKPTFFRSRAVRRLSSNDVRIVWIGLWPLSDDQGRLLDEPDILAGDLWALNLSAEQIDAALAELHEQRRIVRYEVGGERFIQTTNWAEHQKISKPTPSEIPPAPGAEDSGSVPGGLPSGGEGRGEERRGKGTGAESSGVLPDSPPSPFCPKHPDGTDSPCRACGNARRAREAWETASKTKPTGRPPKAGECQHREHPSSPGFCVKCGDRIETAL